MVRERAYASCQSWTGLSMMAEKTPVMRSAQSSRAPLGTCCRVEQRRARIELRSIGPDMRVAGQAWE